nr:VCBS repeat-containing protein [Bacteroidota bacterium]
MKKKALLILSFLTASALMLQSQVFIEVTEYFNGIDVGFDAAPAINDIDGDGLLDLLVGQKIGGIHHYEQIGTNSTSFTLITSTFNSIDVGYRLSPTLVDIDGDGLLDLLVG